MEHRQLLAAPLVAVGLRARLHEQRWLREAAPLRVLLALLALAASPVLQLVDPPRELPPLVTVLSCSRLLRKPPLLQQLPVLLRRRLLLALLAMLLQAVLELARPLGQRDEAPLSKIEEPPLPLQKPPNEQVE